MVYLTIMTEANRLGFEPDIKYFTERVLTALTGSREAIGRTDSKVQPSMVVQLNKRITGVIGKIQKVQDEIKRTNLNTVPVHTSAYEVRHALRTLFPGALEDVITLDQYIQALQWVYKRTSVNLDYLISSVTGNDEVDSRIIDQQMWASSDFVPPEELAIIAGQFLLVKVANRILQPYASQNAANVAAPKIYPGTERAPATAQVLIGLAALLLQVAENRGAVKAAIDRAIADFGWIGNTDEVIAQAEAMGPDPDITEWQKSNRPYHWDLIVRYVQDYLGTNTDPGYEGWMVYDVLEGQKDSMISMESEFGTYGRTTEEVVGAAYEMSLDIYRMMLFQTMDVNTQTNRIATILSSHWLQNGLCCLIMYIGALPTAELNILRFALSLQASGISIDLGAALRTGQSRVNAFLAERVLEPVLHKVDQTFNKFAEEAVKMFETFTAAERESASDKELYDVLMACTPVNHLIEYALRGIGKLKEKLVDLLMRVWSRIELKAVKGDMTWRLLADCKRAKELLSILDAIISGIERGNLCAREGGSTPSVEEVEEFVNRFSVGLPSPIQVSNDGDPYEVFSTEPFKTSLGLQFPGDVEEVGGPDPKLKRFRIDDCLRQNADPQQLLKALGLSVQLGRDLRDARNVDHSRPNT